MKSSGLKIVVKFKDDIGHCLEEKDQLSTIDKIKPIRNTSKNSRLKSDK